MSKKPITAILALVVLLIVGYIVYSQINKARQIVDMFDKPAEPSYSKIMDWSQKFTSVEAAKNKTGIGIMVPTDTLGNKLKSIHVRRGSAAVSKSYIILFENLRIEAIPTHASAEQAKASSRRAVAQFSNRLTKIQVHGKQGFSAAKSEPIVNGIQYKIPTTVAWCEEGVLYLAIAKNMSPEELLRVCNSAKLQ